MYRDDVGFTAERTKRFPSISDGGFMTRKAGAKAANSIDGFDHNAIYKEMPPNLKVASSNLALATRKRPATPKRERAFS
jgi:hypothetical protein